MTESIEIINDSTHLLLLNKDGNDDYDDTDDGTDDDDDNVMIMNH